MGKRSVIVLATDAEFIADAYVIKLLSVFSQFRISSLTRNQITVRGQRVGRLAPNTEIYIFDFLVIAKLTNSMC